MSVTLCRVRFIRFYMIYHLFYDIQHYLTKTTTFLIYCFSMPPYPNMNSAISDLKILTDLIQYICDRTHSEDIKHEDIEELDRRSEELEGEWAKADKLYRTIGKKDPKDNDDYKNFKQKFFETKKIYEDARKTLRRLRKSKGNETVVSRGSENGNISKLLDLPKFDGKIAQWADFKELFESKVTNNISLSNADKLNYLKKSLIGQIANFVPNTEERFDRAWKELVKRYDNRHLLKRRLLYNMFRYYRVSDYDCLMSDYEDLKSLEVTVDDLFMFIAMYIFRGSNLLHEWDSNVSQREPSETQNLSYAEFISFVSKYYYCPVCKANHHLSKCPQFLELSVSERKDQVRSNNFCYGCLGSGHPLKGCTLNLKCEKCHKIDHHTLLHFEYSYHHSTDSNIKRSASDPDIDSYPHKRTSANRFNENGK